MANILTAKRRKIDVVNKIDELINKYLYDKNMPLEYIKGYIIEDLSDLYFDVCGIDENESNKRIVETKFENEKE